LWAARTQSPIGQLWARSLANLIAFSPDGSPVAAAALDGSVYVWDRARSQLKAELRGHEGEVWSVTFTGDGRSLVSGDAGGIVRRWNLATKVSAVLGKHDGIVHRLATSPDGKLLGTPSNDGTARVWDLATGQPTAVLRGHRGGVKAFRFSPDSKLAATVGSDGTVRTWDVATGRPYWRAPLVLRSPPRIFTHRGWLRLDVEQNDQAAAGSSETGFFAWRNPEKKSSVIGSWRWAVAEQARMAVQLAVDEKARELSPEAKANDGNRAGRGGTERDDDAADSRSRPAHRDAGECLCLLTHDGELQLWSMAANRLLASVSLSSAMGLPQATTPAALPATRSPQRDPPPNTEATPARPPALRAKVPAHAAKDALVVTQLAATRRGCLVRIAGRALLLTGFRFDAAPTRTTSSTSEPISDPASGTIRELAEKASTVAFQAGRILIASDEKALVLDENGNEVARTRVEQGVSALGLVDGGRFLVVGHDAGDIAILPIEPATTARPATARPSVSFEETERYAIESVSEGPRQTLIVGYASGHVGIWSLQTGKRLRRFKLHGPVIHLFVDKETRHLYAATEVGDYRAIDLSGLFEDYCELLGDIWSNVPVVWEGGMPVAQRPPAGHRCSF
ncbi:MAG: hypothetical protein V2A73_08860, partial [Pseudomonadota bacterium]